MSYKLDSVKAYFQPALRPNMVPQPAKEGKNRAPVYKISPVQFERIRHDMKSWRDASVEAEQPWYPHRVRQQRMYLDTILNEHVEACINRRKNLTLLRKFKVCDAEGNVNEEVTNLLKKTWFRTFQSYVLDAKLHGYNLITLGDIVNDEFPNISFVQRQNVSPDRMVVSKLVYSLTGEPFLDPEYLIDGKKPYDWSVYVTTPTETGASPCGYGLLYKIAKAEIILRNNTGQNADYNELFGQPIRKGKTAKTGPDRDDFENALRSMGSSAYILLDGVTDEVDLVTASGTGTAHQTYANLEERLEKKISKVLLGHADAMDSTPGKLGGDQGGKESPAASALLDVQTDDGEFIMPVVNEQLLPKMRNLGFNIPLGLKFEYINDAEKEEFRKKEDESNKVTVEIMQGMKNAGGDLSDETWQWFEDRTGIPGVRKAKPELPKMESYLGGPSTEDDGMEEEKENAEKEAELKGKLSKATGFKRDQIKAQLDRIQKKRKR